MTENLMPLLTDQKTLQHDLHAFHTSLKETEKTIQQLHQITNAGKQLQTLHNEASTRFAALLQQYTLSIQQIDQSKQTTQALVQDLQTTHQKMQDFLLYARKELDHLKIQTETQIKKLIETSLLSVENKTIFQHQEQKKHLEKTQDDFLRQQAVRIEAFRDETSRGIGAFEAKWQNFKDAYQTDLSKTEQKNKNREKWLWVCLSVTSINLLCSLWFLFR
jgi:hypothetical protein